VKAGIQNLNEIVLASSNSVVFALCSLCEYFSGNYCILDFHWNKRECPKQRDNEKCRQQ
jgi:hypothetical protein